MARSRISRQSPAAMALLAATCLTPLGWAQAGPGDPRGDEFQINSHTTQRQAEPAVAMDRDGDFVVVWQSNNQDGSFYGIYAQRYNALGVAQGGEFRVNVTTGGSQNLPAVAMDDDGNFVVVWESYQDGAGYGVYARRYDVAGAAQGGEFRVNAATAGDQRNPAVAMDADGDFVVAWQGPDANGDGVYARRYDAAGVAQVGEVQVNTYTTNDQNRPTLAMNAGGDFVVVWQSYGQDGDTYGVYAQRYNAAGTAQGSEFPVNTTTGGFQRHPAVAMDPDGDFVVAWEDFTHDGDGWGIYAQRYDALGVAQGGNFVANSLTFGWQNRPSVAMDADGGFAVSWHSTFHEGDGLGVFARRFDAAGAALGTEDQVNTYTTLDQDYPDIAANAYGDLIVTWRSNGQDTDRTGIFGQRITGDGAVSADFSADRRSDIPWRHMESGKTVIWQMNGFAKEAVESIGSPVTDWQIEGTGDFNGDAISDVLWRDTTSGATTIWLMSGAVTQASTLIGRPSAVWQIVGLGDFDGDGNADILWRNVTTGATVIWRMDGLKRLASFKIGAPSMVWQAVGLGDFDGDGISDILWRNGTTGATAIWQMEELGRKASHSIGKPSTVWRVAAVGDLDGDRVSDIVWRNGTTNKAVAWEINGFNRTTVFPLGRPSAVWQIVRAGDYDGDGVSDILWRNSSNGKAVIWRMSDFVRETARSIGEPSTVWQVQ